MSKSNIDVDQLISVVREGLKRPDAQDGVIGALEVLGKLREQRAVPLYREALRHSNNQTRSNAALALHYCGDPEGLAALIRWSGEVATNSRGALQAMYRLAKISEPQAAAALRKIQEEHGSQTLMFQGNQRSVSYIVDSLLGSGTSRDPGGATSSKSAVQTSGGGCLTTFLAILIGAAAVVRFFP